MSSSVTYLETSHFRVEINVLLKVYSNTAVGRAFLATFLATFLERLLATLLTTLSPEGRKSNPRKKNAENDTNWDRICVTFVSNVFALEAEGKTRHNTPHNFET